MLVAHQFVRDLGEEVMHHRHVGLTAGDFGATVEDEGGGEVHGGKGRLRGEMWKVIQIQGLSTRRAP